MNANKEILMKFITGQNEKVKQDVSMQGYKDDSPYRNNPSNTIYGTEQGTPITMEGVSIPLIGMDEFGNKQEMFPGQEYNFPGTRVIETPMAKYGGSLLSKTIKCSNCGWSWKAADGGNDVTTCHKCGNENTIMQLGGETDFNKVKDWFNTYIQSPLYKENLEKSGYKDVDKVIEQRRSNVGKTEYVYDENRLGTYYQPNTNTVHHAPEKDSERWSKEYKSVLPHDTVLAHEFGHSVLDDSKSFFGKQTPGYNRYDYEQLQSRNKDRKISRGPNENYADQKALQYEAAKLDIYKPGFEEFTKEHLDKLPVDIKDRALQNYSEEDLIWLMNNIAQNDNNIDDQMFFAKRGGSWFGNADEMSVSNKYDTGGTTIAEQYTQLTGKPWSTAKTEGLTDGSYQQNIALIERLKNPKPVVTEQPIVVEEPFYSDDTARRKELAKRVVQLAEERIKNNNYIDVPTNVKEAAYARGEVPYGCIGGVCTIYKDAGVMKNVDWSNTNFAKNAKDYGFTANNGWGVKGINNLEPGDLLMYSQHKNAQGNYYPSHSQIFLGKTNTGQYRFFDNFRKDVRIYDESDVKDKVDVARKKTEVSATIYKVNPFVSDNMSGMSKEAIKDLEDKKEFIEKESKLKASYKWKILDKSTDYNKTTKRVMDNFILFANDNDKINDLVKKTGKSKEEIQDSLLNVFGELGVENNWTSSKGKGIGSRLENIAESLLTSVGAGKGLSVGPGQIKYSELQKEADAAKLKGMPSLKEQFNITSPNDLYDINKVLPLMTAMDLRDKQVLENWGKNNTLSQKLFGWTRPEIQNGDGPGITTGGFQASQLASETGNSILDNGVGRYSPYLRNQYSSINSGTTYEGGNDWVPFNESTLPNFSPARYNESNEDEMKIKYQRDPGSYPYKVEQNWRGNLAREIVPSEDGSIELSEVVVKGKKKKR